LFCGSAQLNEAGAVTNQEIAKELCLPPVKLHCSSEPVLSCFANFASHCIRVSHGVYRVVRSVFKSCGVQVLV